MQALNIADIDRIRYANIRDSVPAILFLAVPHRGSDLASFPSVLTGIANIALKGTGVSRLTGEFRSDLVQSLERGSPRLSSIARNFRHRTADIKFYSFFEKEMTFPLKRLVCISPL